MKSRRRHHKKRSAYRKRHNFTRRYRGGFFGYDGIPFFSKKTDKPVAPVKQSNLNDMRLSERPTNDWSEQPRYSYSSSDERNAEYGYPEDLESETQYPPETPAMGGKRRTKRRHHKRKGTHKRRR
jgi:hypothetical protein